MPKYRSKANGTVVEAERFRPGDKEQAGRLDIITTEGGWCMVAINSQGHLGYLCINDGDLIICRVVGVADAAEFEAVGEEETP